MCCPSTNLNLNRGMRGRWSGVCWPHQGNKMWFVLVKPSSFTPPLLLHFDLSLETLRVNAGAYGVVVSHQGKQL